MHLRREHVPRMLWGLVTVWFVFLVTAYWSTAKSTTVDSATQAGTTFLPIPGQSLRPKEAGNAIPTLFPPDSSVVLLALGAECEASIAGVPFYDDVYRSAVLEGHAFRIVIATPTGQLPAFARRLPDAATIIADTGGAILADIGVALVPSALLVGGDSAVLRAYFPGHDWPPTEPLAFKKASEVRQ